MANLHSYYAGSILSDISIAGREALKKTLWIRAAVNNWLLKIEITLRGIL